MNLISEKYKNWLVSLESDNFSLFIKTWFAFLSSIQTLHSNTTEEGPDGDRRFINAYAKGCLKKVSIDHVLQSNIVRVYELSKPLIMAEYYEFYFPTFFRLNKNFHLEIIDKKNDLSLLFKVTGNDKERKLDINLHSNKKKFQETLGFHLNTVIILNDYIQNHDFENWNIFYRLISASIRNEGLRLIESKTKAGTKTYDNKIIYLDIILGLLNPQIRTQFSPLDLFNPLPNANYPLDKHFEQEAKEWFVDFSYKLRNILFHSILDPFNSKWSDIVKHCYQGLREILIQNIQFIGELNDDDSTEPVISEHLLISEMQSYEMLTKTFIQDGKAIVNIDKTSVEEIASSKDRDIKS